MYLAVVFLVLFFVFSFLAITFKHEWERIDYMGLQENADYRYYYDLFKKWEKRCQRAWIICFVMIGPAIYIEILIVSGQDL